MLTYSCNETMLNKKEFFDKHQEFIPLLPQFEQDIIHYYFYARMKQSDIAILTGKTQGAISLRINRAQKRLIFLSKIKGMDFELILKDIENVVKDNFDIEVIRLLISTTCQSEVAGRLNDQYQLKGVKKMNQVKVRHRFERCLITLRHLAVKEEKYLDYYKKLMFIKENLYIMHEIKLPHFER